VTRAGAADRHEASVILIGMALGACLGASALYLAHLLVGWPS
jgi:hypothetical protein